MIMLYFLLSTLLFAVSFSDIECNSILYTDPKSGNTIGIPTDQCQIENGQQSLKYVCDETKIKLLTYNTTTDCSNNPSSTIDDLCAANDCTSICNKNDCIGIIIISYQTDDCTGDILNKINILPDICLSNNTLSSSSSSVKISCNGTQIEINEYNDVNNCSNTPSKTEKKDSGICVKTDSGSEKYVGCYDSDSYSNYYSSFTTFKLLLLIILFLIF